VTTYTVGPGKTYSSVAAALAALPAGTFSSTQQIDVYTKSGGYSETNGNVITGYGTTSSFLLIINAVDFFDGTPGSKVYVFDPNDLGTFRINQNYLHLVGLEIRGGTNNSVQLNGGTGQVVKNCYLTPSVGFGGASTDFDNTICYGGARPWDTRSASAVVARNCIIGSDGSTDLTVISGPEAVYTNCYAFGASTAAWWPSGPTSGSYNASDDTSASVLFTHPANSSAIASSITSVPTTWTQKTGGTNPLVGTGIFISGAPANDMFGNARPGSGSWDIGPWQAVSANAYTLTAGAGSIGFAGVAASLKIGRKTSAVVGAFSLSGKTVGLLYARKFPSAVGAFAFSGQTVALKVGRKVGASTGTFAFTGQPSGLRATRLLSLGTGTFSFTGQDAAFNKGRLVSAGSGAFGISGQAAGLAATRKLGAGQGTFSFTGQVATLLKGKTLAAGQGALAFSGQPAGLRYARALSAAPDSIAFSGQNVGLRFGRKSSSADGAFAFSGQAASFHYSRSLSSSPGAFAFTGYPAALIATGIKRLASMTIDVSAGQSTFEVTAGTADIGISASP
jgi:hypothetical protein